MKTKTNWINEKVNTKIILCVLWIAVMFLYVYADIKTLFQPDIPEKIRQAPKQDRMSFGAALMEWAATEPKALASMPFVLAQTLGQEWDSAAKAALWGLLMTSPKVFRANAARAGFEPGIDQGDRIFQALLDNPQGVWVGRADEENVALL